VTHPFRGDHLLLAYEGCAVDLQDEELLDAAMREGIAASGATILSRASTRFEPQGLSIVFLLAESHASVHSYPEHRSAFLDIFTCGTTCDPARFDEVMRRHLRPTRAVANLVRR
jgi:S-adenosylmethionine decarboxylase